MSARSMAALGFALALGALPLAAGAADLPDFKTCSKQLAQGAKPLPADRHRQCLIAIASTYVDFEQGTRPKDEVLLADDVSRHPLGTPADHQAGAHEKIRASKVMEVIGAIKNRAWIADGNTAWVTYEGYLRADMSKPGFWVAERFTIENGVIKEILLPQPAMAKKE